MMSPGDDEPLDVNGFDLSRVQGILCADEDFARRAESILAKLAIPTAVTARNDGKAVLAVPAENGNQAIHVLLAVKGIVLDRLGEPYFRPFDSRTDDVLFDHPILTSTPESLRANGPAALESALADLEACVTRGHPPVVSRALTLLTRLGQDAWTSLDRLLLAAIRRRDAARVGDLLRAGRGAEGRKESGLPGSLRELVPLSRDADTAVRQLSLRALGAIRAFDAATVLADALLDPDPEVAIEADDAFLHWGAGDEGFDPDLDIAEKRRIADVRRGFRQPPA